MMNEASGTVTEAGKSKTGSDKLKIGGQWYYMGRGLKGTKPEMGATIELKYSLFGDQGTLRSLEAWRPVSGGSVASSQATHIPTRAPVDEASLRFISNVVGSAITHGSCEAPDDVIHWFRAAKYALNNKPYAEDEPVPGIDDRHPEDEFDSDVPF